MSVLAWIILILIVMFFVSGVIYIISDDMEDEQIYREIKEEIEMFKTMSYGAEGKEIAEVQKMLQMAGSTIKVTGKFNIGMISAVKSFQKKNGLPVTGKVDSKTMAKLKTYLKPAKPARKPLAKKAPVKK